MPKQKIVLACETEDAHGLINSVNDSLTEKLANVVDTRKQELGSRLLRGAKLQESDTWNDPYVDFEPKLQEAIDEIVERVDLGEELDGCIKRTAAHRSVSEEKIREYFQGVIGGDVHTDSTKSDDNTPNSDAMNDEDVSKRVRFESVQELLGSKIQLTEDQFHRVQSVYERLNDANRQKMAAKLKADRTQALNMVRFCLEVAGS